MADGFGMTGAPSPSVPMIVLSGILAVVALVAAGVPMAVALRFALLVAVGFFLPGTLLVPTGLRRHQGIAVALALGLVTAAVLWAIAISVGVPPRVTLAVLFLLAVAALMRGSWRLESSDVRPDAAIALACIACTLSVAWTQFGDGRFVAGGVLRFTGTYAPEALFHSAIAQQLRHHLPLEFPAGVTIAYHVGYHIVAALITETTGAELLDVNYRLLPVLLVPMTVLSAVGLGQAVGASTFASVTGALFLFFADDLSWLFASIGLHDREEIGGRSWNILLGAPLLYALHHNRGFLMGVAAVFPAAIVAARYFREGGVRNLAATALLALALFELKVPFFFIFVAALGLVASGRALVEPAETRAQLVRRGGAAVLICTMIVFRLLLPFFAADREGSSGIEWAPGEAGLLPLVRLGLIPGDRARGTPDGDFGAVTLLIGSLVLLLGTSGVRLVGVSQMFEVVRRRDHELWLVTAIVAVGAAVTVLFVTPPARFNTVYFWGVSLAVLAVLSGVVVGRALEPTLRWSGAAIIAVLAVAALPGTLQMLWVERSVRAPTVLRTAPGTDEIVGFLSLQANPRDVLLEPPADFSVLAAATAVNPVIAWPQWIVSTLGRGFVDERLDDASRFFSAADDGTREAILERYGVDWVFAPRGSQCSPLDRLSLVAENRAGRLFRVVPTSTGSQEPAPQIAPVGRDQSSTFRGQPD